ncbi:MAG: Uncharacterised protein [Flavobacterium sp. SCGC AAA160-P02]|nr:MAG: Uncharacterised protein [Flavobacterium sp. SCGC AAA160-P02]
MTKYLLTVFFCIILISCQTTPKNKSKENWIQLFNGKDLKGWIPKISGHQLGDNYKNTFRVEDGLLKVSYDGYDTFESRYGHLFYEKPFSHYKILVEYRFVGEQAFPNVGDWAYRNNGIMMHCQSPQSMGLYQEFPVSLEGQLLGGNGIDERPNGNLCTPGLHVLIEDRLETNHCINSTSKTFHGDDWVTAEFVILGNESMHHIIEGDTVMSYSKPQIGGDFLPENYPIPDGTLISNGYISLQSETHPIEFKTVALMELDSLKN